MNREEVKRRLASYGTGVLHDPGESESREALETALAAMEERDRAAQEAEHWRGTIYEPDRETLVRERDAALAENRLLRDILERAVIDGDDVISEAAVVLYSDEGKAIALTAAEAERVRRLEKVAEAAKALRSEHRADFMDDGARQDRLYELFQLLDEHDEAAALAELDAGEGAC